MEQFGDVDRFPEAGIQSDFYCNSFQDEILKIVEGITTFLANSTDSDEPFDPSAIVNGCRGILFASGNVADASSEMAAAKLQSNETVDVLDDEELNGTQATNSVSSWLFRQWSKIVFFF